MAQSWTLARTLQVRAGPRTTVASPKSAQAYRGFDRYYGLTVSESEPGGVAAKLLPAAGV